MRSLFNCYFFIFFIFKYTSNQAVTNPLIPQIGIINDSINQQGFPNQQAIARIGSIGLQPNGLTDRTETISLNPSGEFQARLNPFIINAQLNTETQTTTEQGAVTPATVADDSENSLNSLIPSLATELEMLEFQREQAQTQIPVQAQAQAQQLTGINLNPIPILNNPNIVIDTNNELSIAPQPQQASSGLLNALGNFPVQSNNSQNFPSGLGTITANAGLNLGGVSDVVNSPSASANIDANSRVMGIVNGLLGTG